MIIKKKQPMPVSMTSGSVRHSHCTVRSAGHLPGPRTDYERIAERDQVSLHTRCMFQIPT